MHEGPSPFSILPFPFVSEYNVLSIGRDTKRLRLLSNSSASVAVSFLLQERVAFLIKRSCWQPAGHKVILCGSSTSQPQKAEISPKITGKIRGTVIIWVSAWLAEPSHKPSWAFPKADRPFNWRDKWRGGTSYRHHMEKLRQPGFAISE